MISILGIWQVHIPAYQGEHLLPSQALKREVFRLFLIPVSMAKGTTGLNHELGLVPPSAAVSMIQLSNSPFSSNLLSLALGALGLLIRETGLDLRDILQTPLCRPCVYHSREQTKGPSGQSLQRPPLICLL